MVILSPSSLVFTFDSCRNSFTIPMTKIIMGGNNYHYRPQRSWGKVIFSEACVKNSVHKGGGVVSQHALQVVSQHALQVSRPTPRGEVEVSGLMGSPGPHLGGLKPTPRGFSRPTPRGVSQHALRQIRPPPRRRLMLQAVRILLECILVIILNKIAFQ